MMQRVVVAPLLGVMGAALLGSCAQPSPGSGSSQTPRSTFVDDAAARAFALEALKKSIADPVHVPDPPDVTPVRWVRPEELPDLMDSCVASQGFPKNADGTMDTPPARINDFYRAMYVCTLRYPILPKYAQPQGEAQKRAAYKWTVGYLLPCLKAHGYELEAPVPSEPSFIDTWGTAEAFYPYTELTARVTEFGITNAMEARLERECPQMPPSTVMWDGMSIAEYTALHPLTTATASG